MNRTTRQLGITLLSVILLLNLTPAPYAARGFAPNLFDTQTDAGRTRRRQPDRAAHKRPKRVAQVRVAKTTYPATVSWEHDGRGAVEYVVYRGPKDNSAPPAEIARVPAGDAGQQAYVFHDPGVSDAAPYRYGVAVRGAERLSATTFSEETTPIAAATTCQVNDISFSDYDGDGISNDDEYNGYEIFVAPLTASPTGIADQLLRDKPVSKKVYSSEYYDDTDGDGLCDWQELPAKTDPSSKDTDGDGLGDYDEIITWNSDATDPDSDSDAFAPVLTLVNGQQVVQYVTLASADAALVDGREACASSGFPCDFQTSPTIADTDGDSYTDYDEIIQLGSQFNPLIANLPQLELSLVGTADLSLTIAYSDSTQQAQTKSTSLAQGQSTTDQNYASTVRKTWDKYGQKVSASASYNALKGATYSVNVEASFEEGTATTKTNGWSDSTTNQSQQTYDDAVQTARQQGREITGGSISMGVQIENTGLVSYDLTDLTVTALQHLPEENSFETIGTLTLATPLGTDGITLAPGGTTGVLQVKSDATADRILKLMSNPASLYFDIASFQISNAQKVDFDFIDQVTNAQTGSVLIDFGGNSVISKRVATNVAREGGKIAGIHLDEAMKTLGINFETESVVIEGQTVTVLTGVQNPDTGEFVRVDATNNQFWVALRTAATEGALPQNFEDVTLEAGGAVYLLFVTDGDGDNVYLRDEFLYGTSDANPDTDADGLSDFDEIATGWQVTATLPPNYPVQVFPNPVLADADNDGFNDKQEQALATDPNSPDTDGDLLCDGNGSSVNATGLCAAGSTPDPQPLVPRFAFIGSTPPPYVFDAAAAAPIVINFTLPVRADSTLSVRSVTRGPVAGTVSFSNGGRTLTFTPTNPFMANEVIEVSVSGVTSEASGARLPDYHYTFRVAAPPGSGELDAGQAQFTLDDSPQFRVTAMVSGDFNQDNLIDIAMTGYNDDGSGTTTSDVVFVAFNSGAGDFAGGIDTIPFADNSAPQALVAGDFNGDGRPDLATANRNSNNVGVLLAGSTVGEIDEPVYYGAGQGPVSIAAGDFNGDGHLDLATANGNEPDGSGNTILLGQGDGTFTAGTSPASGASPHAVAVGDVNNDGFLDLVTAYGTSGSAGVFTVLGNGDGTFSPTGTAQPFTATGFPVAIATGDFNADGLLDVVTANQGSDDVSLLLNNGDGVFTPQANTPVATNPNAVIVVDINGDGKLDVVTANALPGTESPAAATVLFGQTNVGNFERLDVGPDNSPMSGTALIADQIVGPPTAPLVLVVAGFGNASGYQVQLVFQD